MKIASYGQYPMVVPCCPSDQNLCQKKKKMLTFLSNISKEIEAISGHFPLMNIIFLIISEKKCFATIHN